MLGHEAVCVRVVCLRVHARARARAAITGWMRGRGYLCFSIFFVLFFEIRKSSKKFKKFE